MRHLSPLISGILWLLTLGSLPAEWVWVEGEDAVQSQMVRRHSWYEDVKKGELSGGDFMTNYTSEAPGTAEYEFAVKAPGQYDLYFRVYPVLSQLSYSVNGGEMTPLNFKGDVTGNLNIASDDKPDMRFLAWVKAGPVELKAGAHKLRILMDSPKVSYHGMLDCFVVTNEPFNPRGVAKPDEIAKEEQKIAQANAGWRVWAGPLGRDGAGPVLDAVRAMNEKVAGENGRIIVKDGHFTHEKTGEPVRFWAVNGPPRDLGDEPLMAASAQLANYGVNLVRLHGGIYDRENGQVDPALVQETRRIVRAAKANGIYAHLSIYFPLWLQPKGDLPFLKGNAGKHPFASIYFNEDFQETYRGWWRSLLTEPGSDGQRLIDDPAVMGLELVNEDSLFFWTFKYGNIPAEQMAILERKFAAWAKAKYGSYEKALAAWDGQSVPQDAPGEDRLGFRPLWNMFNEKTKRDQDTAAFLMETQRKFYEDHVKFLRDLGFKGLITASNWITANDQVFGPLERYSYTTGDFIDRHGYFGNVLRGAEAGWSIREGYTFGHRSALTFQNQSPGKPPVFSHPIMDAKINGKPSMISETSWTHPNKYRGEAPLYYAVYGALQDSDSIVHFALEGTRWEVKPGFFMKLWNMMTPTQMGQWPAASLIYRQALVEAGPVMADIQLPLAEMMALKGTPLAQSANLDELRAADLPSTGAAGGPSSISPLIHYVGRTNVHIGEKVGQTKVAPLGKFIDLKERTVTSATGQVKLDFGRGIMAVNSPKAQVVCGNLTAAGGSLGLDLVEVRSDLEQLYLALVPLDGQPLATSKSMLLQVMTEEKSAGFTTEPTGEGLERITSLGKDPWLIRAPRGEVRLKRANWICHPLTDAFKPVDADKPITGGPIPLDSGMAYYHITAK